MDKEPPQERGKFDSLVDEMLYTMSQAGWANASSGSVEASTGYFARISIETAELPEIVWAFNTEFSAAGFTDHHALLGHFLVREKPEGVVVEEYDSEQELIGEYEALRQGYLAEGGESCTSPL